MIKSFILLNIFLAFNHLCFGKNADDLVGQVILKALAVDTAACEGEKKNSFAAYDKCITKQRAYFVKAVQNVIDLKSVESDKALVRLLAFDFGVSNSETIQQEILNRGKRIIKWLNEAYLKRLDCLNYDSGKKLCFPQHDCQETIKRLISDIQSGKKQNEEF